MSLAQTNPNAGLIVLIQRRTRVAECSQFLRLLNRAGESGIRDNINFAKRNHVRAAAMEMTEEGRLAESLQLKNAMENRF